MNYSHTDTDIPIENQYPKLIRDKIPELIKSQGKHANTRVASSDDEYLEFLFLKLIEEATELHQAKKDEYQMEELADVFEVLEAILELTQFSRDDIARIQDQKKEKRGGFKDRLLLVAKP